MFTGEKWNTIHRMAVALEIYEALRSVGVDDAKAKSTAEKFDQALDARFQQELKTLATREDIERLRAEMFEAMGKLRSEMIKWMFVFIFGQLWAIIGVLFAFFR